MQLKIFVRLLGLLMLVLGSSQQLNECILGVRIYPLRYLGSMRTVEFRTELKSNCLEFPLMNLFVLPYNKDFKLSDRNHPTKIVLTLFRKNTYVFDFMANSRSQRRFRRALNVVYSRFRAPFSSSLRPISAIRMNNILLKTTKGNEFNKRQIDKLIVRKNPALCKLSKRKLTMYCSID